MSKAVKSTLVASTFYLIVLGMLYLLVGGNTIFALLYATVAFGIIYFCGYAQGKRLPQVDAMGLTLLLGAVLFSLSVLMLMILGASNPALGAYWNVMNFVLAYYLGCRAGQRS